MIDCDFLLLCQSHAVAAKAGIERLAWTLANEWGRYGVRVNNVCPGPIADTVGFEKLGKSIATSQQMKFYKHRIPVQRFGNRQDISGLFF